MMLSPSRVATVMYLYCASNQSTSCIGMSFTVAPAPARTYRSVCFVPTPFPSSSAIRLAICATDDGSVDCPSRALKRLQSIGIVGGHKHNERRAVTRTHLARRLEAITSRHADIQESDVR